MIRKMKKILIKSSKILMIIEEDWLTDFSCPSPLPPPPCPPQTDTQTNKVQQARKKKKKEKKIGSTQMTTRSENLKTAPPDYLCECLWITEHRNELSERRMTINNEGNDDHGGADEGMAGGRGISSKAHRMRKTERISPDGGVRSSRQPNRRLDPLSCKAVKWIPFTC